MGQKKHFVLMITLLVLSIALLLYASTQIGYNSLNQLL